MTSLWDGRAGRLEVWVGNGLEEQGSGAGRASRQRELGERRGRLHALKLNTMLNGPVLTWAPGSSP